MDQGTSQLQSDVGARWLTLLAVCSGVLIVMMDTTIVNVALPSIREALGFEATTLVWVVNAYMLTFGGTLILGGRLGDLYGHRAVFLVSIVLFTTASLLCGLAEGRSLLVGSRAVQGLAGGMLSAVSISLITDMFDEGEERARAMGIYAFVCAVGGVVGLLLGGLLITALGWRSIFLVNIPLGTIVFVVCHRSLRNQRAHGSGTRLDFGGAATATASLLVMSYALTQGNLWGWMSPRTVSLFVVAAVLLVIFVVIETRTGEPLVPLGVFRRRNVTVSSLVRILWAGAACGWFFTSALYMQFVLGYEPLEVALAFLPANFVTAAFALGLSAKVVLRFGVRKPIFVGLLLISAGLALFSRAPVNGNLITDVLPSMVILGLGSGITFNPLLIATMQGVSSHESGLVSGISSTASVMGGALGLAILTAIAASRTDELLAAGVDMPGALAGGYRVAFASGAVCAVLAAFMGGTLLRAGVPWTQTVDSGEAGNRCRLRRRSSASTIAAPRVLVRPEDHDTAG